MQNIDIIWINIRKITGIIIFYEQARTKQKL